MKDSILSVVGVAIIVSLICGLISAPVFILTAGPDISRDDTVEWARVERVTTRLVVIRLRCGYPLHFNLEGSQCDYFLNRDVPRDIRLARRQVPDGLHNRFLLEYRVLFNPRLSTVVDDHDIRVYLAKEDG